MIVNGRVGDTAHHSTKAEVVHREEGQVEENQGGEEVSLAERFIQHFAEHFREPEVEGSVDREDTSAKEHIVEVRDDEVGVVNEKIDWCGGHENAAEAADDEHRDERKREAHRCGELNRTAPHGAHPVEGFDGRRDGDIMVETEKAALRVRFMPLTNMWWPHTMKPRNPIAIIA